MITADASRQSLWKVFGYSAAAVALIALVWKLVPVNLFVLALLGSVSSLGWWAPAVYSTVYVVAAMLGVPRTPLNIGAGIIFSFPVAFVVVMASATATFLLTFQIARHVASEWVEQRIASIPKAKQIMQAVEEEGFKLVLLLRMNPFVPAVVKGYGFGTTSIGLGGYLVASILGFLPIGITHIYLGWIGGAAMMASGAQPPALRMTMLVVGGAVSLVLVIFVTWFSQRALDQRTGS